MNFNLFLIQNVFQEFDFSQNYFYLAQLDVENPSKTRNPNPTRIQDVIRNPYPTWIEDPLTYNGSPIIWARAKKMKEALHMLIPVIWA